MDFDYGEIEGYRSVYAQALIQLRKDLNAPVQQFYYSVQGRRGNPQPVDWHIVLISHLAALERDKDSYDASLMIPSLSFAVSLWMTDRLLGFGLMSREPRDSMQRFINDALQLRLDMIWGQGDPLLTALCAHEFPSNVRDFTRNVGLGAGKAEEIADLLLREAQPLALVARNLFSMTYEPAKRSMFRPSPSFMEELHRSNTYENQI